MSRKQPTAAERGPVRAVIYARLSDDRDGDAQGVARQIEACRERAEREGWTLVGEPLRDDSISAWRSGVTRPAYQELLRMIRDRQADVVLVWHMSRLWRGRAERATGIDVFKDAGVRLAVVQGSEIDFSTAMGRGVAGMLGEVDTMESDLKSERIRAQKQQAAEQGRYRGGRRPFGFEADGVTLREAEAAAIREATRGVLAGRSLNGIAKEWNGRGLPTSTGLKWNQAKVKRVLLRPRNAGLVNTGHAEAYDVKIIEGVKAQWPAIVDEEEFHALYSMLTDATRRRSAEWAALKWFGSGIYRCGLCGGPMRSATVHSGKRKFANYRCAEFSHITVMAVKTDEHVKQEVARLVRDPRVAAALSAGDPDALAADRERRRLLVARLEQTAADYDDDLIDARRYKAKVEKITAELVEVEARLDRGVQAGTVLPIFSEVDPGEAFLSAPLDIQRAVLRAVLRVEVVPNTRRGAAWSSERLRLEPVA